MSTTTTAEPMATAATVAPAPRSFAEVTIPAFTPRKTYAKGKLRPITLAQAREFHEAVSALLAGYPTPADAMSDSTVWLVPTAYGWLRVTLYPIEGESGSQLFSVFTKLEGSKEDLARAVARFGRDSINQFNGKWNVHQYQATDAFGDLLWQLEASDAGEPLTLAAMSPDLYSAEGGPGCAQKVAQYRGQRNALKKRADEGDLLAASDYAAAIRGDSISYEVERLYSVGPVDADMRFDMSLDWREHVRLAIEAREPVNAAVDRYGIELPSGYALQGDRYVWGAPVSPLAP